MIRISEIYGNPTPPEIESPTLSPGRFNLSKLRPFFLPTASGLREVSLHYPIGVDCQLRTFDITNIDQ